MNANGTFGATDARPGFPWNTVVHTSTRNNTKLWKIDRPIPMMYDLPMDWHHMIPWNAIRNSWSALVTSGCWDVVENWLDLLSVDNSDTHLASMKAGNLATVPALDVTEKLCWAKWNLVEGPTNTYRTDDPGGDGFDKFATLKFSSNVRTRSLTLHSVYEMVRNWAVSKNDVSDKEAKLLNGYFTAIRPYKNSPIAMFEPAAWAIDKDGKFDGFGNASRHPTWKKAI